MARDEALAEIAAQTEKEKEDARQKNQIILNDLNSRLAEEQAAFDDNSKKLREKANEDIEALEAAAERRIQAIGEFGEVAAEIAEVIDTFNEFWEEHGELISGIVGTVYGFIEKFILNKIKRTLKEIRFFMKAVSKAWEVWNEILELAEDVWEEIVDLLDTSLEDMLEFLEDFITDSFDEWTQWLDEIVTGKQPS